jgi:predicted O-methyltransferase YrrM
VIVDGDLDSGAAFAPTLLPTNPMIDRPDEEAKSMSTLGRLPRAAKRFMSATGTQLARPDRVERLRRLAMYWVYMNECRLPEKYLVDLWPEIGNTRTQTHVGISREAELPYGERAILDAVVRYLRPRNIFEIGTYTGTTTTLLADAAPQGAVVHTLDLPMDAFATERHAQRIGQEFRDKPEYRDRIVSHRCDSRKFDFSAFRGRMDLVFVDASHEYEDVLRDSRHAVEVVAPQGVILWDDYQASQTGVVQALNEVSSRIELVRVAFSRLVVHRHERP